MTINRNTGALIHTSNLVNVKPSTVKTSANDSFQKLIHRENINQTRQRFYISDESVLVSLSNYRCRFYKVDHFLPRCDNIVV